jgi:hypothetical protein
MVDGSRQTDAKTGKRARLNRGKLASRATRTCQNFAKPTALPPSEDPERDLFRADRPERPFRQPPHKPPPTCRPPRASSASARREPPLLSPTASRARALSRSTASPSRSSSPRSLDSRSTSLFSSSASTSSVCDYLFSPERRKKEQWI